MNTNNLGRLQPVALRAIWSNEAGDFTPWLAQEQNLALLGETIGLDLELEGTEQNVGPFRADIVCKDTVTDTWVLVENQLERTDHSHLGQLITYAAGLDAVTIVWIAARFTEEHRAALDWLNEATGEDVNFFGLEMELWQIDDSPAAPKFNMVSKPNEWTKTVAAGRRQIEESTTEVQELQLAFWHEFVDYLDASASKLKMRKIRPRHSLSAPIGRTAFRLETLAYFVYGEYVGVQLVISPKKNADAYFQLLHDQKTQIETEIGHQLKWISKENQNRSLVVLYNPAMDPNQRAQWPEQHAWLAGTLTAFERAFRDRIKELDPSITIPESEEDRTDR